MMGTAGSEVVRWHSLIGGRVRKLLRLLGSWFVVSLPLDLFLGRSITTGQRRRTVEGQDQDSEAAELKLKAASPT